MKRRAVIALILVIAGFEIARRPCVVQAKKNYKTGFDWPVYDGGPKELHYSPLTQINRSNVAQLTVAWTYDTGERGGEARNRSLETNPIIVGGVLYGLTPSQKVFALNAATGKLLWKFDSGIQGTQPDRGLTYWASGRDKRVLVGVMNFIYALNADTGKPIRSFGDNGRIDLRDNLGRDPSGIIIALTSPGVIYKNLLIVGGMEPETLPCAPGDIRAYDVRTGKLRWSFHTIPHPGEFGYNTWLKNAWKYAGSANNWAGMAVDVKQGIVYVPTGSVAPDFYKSVEHGNLLFSDCELALDAETGKLIWYFQGVRHDLWDRDYAAPPDLLAVTRNGRKVAAVVQTSKQGFVYVFNRQNGRPLFPMKCQDYPPSTTPGEMASKEQCLPTEPAPYARQLLTADMLTNRTPEAHAWAEQQFKGFVSAGQFVPFRVGKPTVQFPGYDGGGDWGGAAADPKTAVLYVNSNDVAWTGELAKNPGARGTARDLYLNHCSLCHGMNRAGSPPDFPSLIGVGKRLSLQEIAATIRQGKGRMPSFSTLSHEQLSALVQFLAARKNESVESDEPAAVKESRRYLFTGYDKFVDRQGYPAVKPPWGTLNAIDVSTGKYLWKIPFGYYPQLKRQGLKATGTENYGGPIVTAGGLLFIAATNFDDQFHAFDTRTGKLLWEATLPFAGNATPATYEVNGRQYVVIAAGAGKASGASPDAAYVAFALPKRLAPGP